MGPDAALLTFKKDVVRGSSATLLILDSVMPYQAQVPTLCWLTAWRLICFIFFYLYGTLRLIKSVIVLFLKKKNLLAAAVAPWPSWNGVNVEASKAKVQCDCRDCFGLKWPLVIFKNSLSTIESTLHQFGSELHQNGIMIALNSCKMLHEALLSLSISFVFLQWKNDANRIS